VGDGDKLRQHAGVVETDMELDCSLALLRMRPGKDLKTQIDGRGVKRIELVLEPEAVSRRKLLATRPQLVEKRLEQLMRLILVDSGETRAAHPPQTEVVELAQLSIEVADEIPETGAARQLGSGHRHELRPTAHPAQFPARMVPRSQAIEFMSRDKLEHLGEDGDRMSHGLVSPVCSVG